MKEVKIQIPDNCELTKDGDSYVVREIKQNPPRSWEEFCERYPIKDTEVYIASDSSIVPSTLIDAKVRHNIDKNWCTSKDEAKAFLALMQLRQLRKAWVGDWEQPIDRNYGVIYVEDNELIVGINFSINRALSFPTAKMAEDFLSCFSDLCETAKNLL